MGVNILISNKKAGLRTVLSTVSTKKVAGTGISVIVDGGTSTCTLRETEGRSVRTMYVTPGSCPSQRTFRGTLLTGLRRGRISLVILTKCLITVPPVVIRTCPGGVVGVRPSLVPSFYKGNFCKLGIRSTILTEKIGMANTAIRFMSTKASANPVVLRGTMGMGSKSASGRLREHMVRGTR